MDSDRNDISLHTRTEERFLILNLEQFLEDINPSMHQVRFSENPCVRTIYFNDDNHNVPFGTAIKARRYTPEKPSVPELDPSEKHFIDFKTGNGFVRERIRSISSLEDAVGLITERYPELPELRPYMILDYRRKHFIPNVEGVSKIRITIDTDISYYFVKPNGSIVNVRHETGYGRVELKSTNPNDPFLAELYRIFAQHGNFPLVSKKFMGYNSITRYKGREMANVRPLYKELGNVEVESKLNVNSDFSFHSFHKDLCNGLIDGFSIQPEFPNILESGSFNRYYENRESKFKALLRANSATIVRKGKTDVLDDQYGLGNILYREEVKEPDIPIDSEILRNSDMIGQLFRMRKVFYAIKPQSGRLYHISIDHCASGDNDLHQLEIEYVGTINKIVDPNPLPKITDDIAKITSYVIAKYNARPTQLTKKAWLLQT